MIDEENNIIWHNGSTNDFNCYIGYDMKKQIAVVILSNLPSDYKASAIMMGSELLRELQE